MVLPGVDRCITHILVITDHYDYSKDHMAINVSPSGGYSGEESALLPVDDDTSEVTTYEFQIRQRQQQT